MGLSGYNQPVRLLFITALLLATFSPVLARDAADDEPLRWGDPVDEMVEESGVSLTEAELQFREHVYDPQLLSDPLRQLSQSSPAPVDGTDSAGLLREILQSEEFQRDQQPQKQTTGIMQQVIEWLDRTLQNIGKALGLGASGGNVLVYALIILALVLVAMIVRQLLMHTGRRGGRLAGESGELDDRDLDLAELARRHAGRGDYRTALRYRFLAVLRMLDLPASTLTTNSMLVRRVASGHPEMHADFRELVGMFEDAWYGSLDCGGPQYEEAERIAGSIDRRLQHAREATE